MELLMVGDRVRAGVGAVTGGVADWPAAVRACAATAAEVVVAPLDRLGRAVATLDQDDRIVRVGRHGVPGDPDGAIVVRLVRRGAEPVAELVLGRQLLRRLEIGVDGHHDGGDELPFGWRVGGPLPESALEQAQARLRSSCGSTHDPATRAARGDLYALLRAGRILGYDVHLDVRAS